MDFVQVARNFDLGFQSDASRDELPKNAAFRLSDWLLPQYEAPLRKRGGWAYASPALSTLGGTAASVAALGFLPFASDGHLVAVSNAGSVYQLKRFDGAGGALVTDTGDATIVPTWPIFYHKTGAYTYGIILPGYSQTHRVPKKYLDTGSLVYQSQALGGVPPRARVGWSWGDYLVLANYYDPTGGTYDLKNNRVAFSGAGLPETWVYTGATSSTFDFPEEVVAGVPLLNTQLVFGYNNCYSFTGDTPPPGGNLTRRLLFAGNGTFDGRTALAWRNYAVWANPTGIWISDGATLTDLTAAAGISNYYRQKVTGFSVTAGWSATAGVYRDHYVLTIRNAAGAIVTTFVCDLSRKTFTEWTNIPSGNFARFYSGPGTALYGGDEELFFAHTSSPRVGKISTLWTPSSTYAADADGAAVLPVLETPFYTFDRAQKKRVRSVYSTYDIRTAGASPVLRVSAVFTPEVGAAYTTLTPDLPTTLTIARRHAKIAKQIIGVGLKFAQVGASADTRMYGVELEGFPQEVTR